MKQNGSCQVFFENSLIFSPSAGGNTGGAKTAEGPAPCAISQKKFAIEETPSFFVPFGGICGPKNFREHVCSQLAGGSGIPENLYLPVKEQITGGGTTGEGAFAVMRNWRNDRIM